MAFPAFRKRRPPLPCFGRGSRLSKPGGRLFKIGDWTQPARAKQAMCGAGDGRRSLALRSVALSLALFAPAAAFSPPPAAWLRRAAHARAPVAPLAGAGGAMRRAAMAGGARMAAGGADQGASASRDFDTLTRQMPSKPIDSGMKPPTISTQLEKLKGDAIPWVVTALLTLPMMAMSRSLYPAVIVAALDLAWFVYSWIQAKEMKVPSRARFARPARAVGYKTCLAQFGFFFRPCPGNHLFF